jgi:hypothetical protein
MQQNHHPSAPQGIIIAFCMLTHNFPAGSMKDAMYTWQALENISDIKELSLLITNKNITLKANNSVEFSKR